MTTVEGLINGHPIRATLEPDGQGGHWLKVDRELREAAGAEAGDDVSLEIAPVAEEPEPKVPADLRKALAAAHPKARAVWSDITPVARRDWIQWIESAKDDYPKHGARLIPRPRQDPRKPAGGEESRRRRRAPPPRGPARESRHIRLTPRRWRAEIKGTSARPCERWGPCLSARYTVRGRLRQ